MDISGYGINAYLKFEVRKTSGQYTVNLTSQSSSDVFIYSEENLKINFELKHNGRYMLSFKSAQPVSLKMSLIPKYSEQGYHIIPCNIHGDNNLENSKPGFFPNLTELHADSVTSSSEWEFRADRASHPVSMVNTGSRTYGVSIEPYSHDKNGKLIRNGVFSKLPSTTGVSLGYRNYPYTFTFKEMLDEPTFDLSCSVGTSGRLYEVTGNRIDSVSKILRDIYNSHRECPEPKHSDSTYLEAFLDSYENINWSEKWEAFTNMECHVPDSTELKPWRPLIATGWTGTGVMAYPLLSAQKILGKKNSFTDKLISQFDSVANSINPRTGMFFDLTRELNGSRVNGWWAGYMVKDCHCAYTNGNGAYYLLKAYLLMEEMGYKKDSWLFAVKSVIDTVIDLQLPNGNYGYTYSLEKPEISDPDGFAGCWFAATSALLYSVNKEKKYLYSAEKAMVFYHTQVMDLNCWGAPMDTWKSIDQEGNLSFIKASAILHKVTGLDKYKNMLIDGANYEYLWRYSFKAFPEYAPLKGSKWNSCGGSVTSVSNPHIHPMGVNVTAELLYLYKITDDIYHLNRAEDGLCWGLATSDLYPETTGYGKLGVISERYCPSDGLVIEKFSNNEKPSSIWFTFNGWAGVSILEGLTEPYITGLVSESVDKTTYIHNIFSKIERGDSL